jgi:DNA-binding GntR family transcriptional regulator
MEGLVTIVPKSGTYVFTPTLEDIAELCDYRTGLEQQAVMLAPDAELKAQANRLTQMLAVMTEAIASDDMPAYGRADTEFHLVFLRGCGNRYLQNAYNLILGRVAALRTHLAISAEGEPDRSYLDHQAMIALLADGARADLSAMLKAHILRTKDNYLNAFEKMAAAKGDVRTARLRRRLAIAS